MRDPRRELASASAARLSGDDYQHLFTLMQAVRLLREDVWGVRRVMMEVDQAGNVDDLIIDYLDKPTLYHQVKFTRLAGKPLEHHWFTDSGSGKKSPLQRFHASFVELAGEGIPPEMALVTNRSIAPNDPVLRCLEGRDGLLTPRIARPDVPTVTKEARAEWAAHLGISDEELFELLDHLRIEASVGTLETLRDRCGEVMMAVGLRGDADAVALGADAIRDLIEAGHDELDADSVRDLVARHGLASAAEVALLEVAAIDHAPFAETATASLNWVTRYEGSEPRERRRLSDPAAAAEMARELATARKAIQAAGYTKVGMRGAFRLDVGFAVGAEFADTAGFQVAITQREEEWSSDGEAGPFVLEADHEEIGSGEELAVCLSISADVGPAAGEFIEGENLLVGALLNLRPGAGVDRTAIGSAAEARGCAQAALDAVRSHVAGSGRIHLFIAAPNGLAVLLGHIWNRLPPTQVYADLSPGYQPSFIIAA